MSRGSLKLFVIHMASLARQQLILVLIFAHSDDNDSYEAKNHSKDLNTINRFTIEVVAED